MLAIEGREARRTEPAVRERGAKAHKVPGKRRPLVACGWLFRSGMCRRRQGEQSQPAHPATQGLGSTLDLAYRLKGLVRSSGRRRLLDL
jgi:hypothetical protein